MSDSRPERFSPDTLNMLRQAGWSPRRDVSSSLKLPRDFTPHPAALRVLSEFGNLRVGRPGPGVGSARTPLVLDPMLAAGEGDQFALFGKTLGSSLYPLGETGNGHSLVAIDERERVFLVFGWPAFVDETFDAALDNLLRGLRPVRWVDEAGRW